MNIFKGKNGESLSSLLLHALGHHPMQMLDGTSILILIEVNMKCNKKLNLTLTKVSYSSHKELNA